jgi:hypothetical protein
MFEVGIAGRMQSTVDHGPMFRQNFAPVSKKLRVIMLTRKVRLQARPNVDVHAIGILALWPRSVLLD